MSVGVDVAFHSCGYWNPHQIDFLNSAIESTLEERVVTILDIFKTEPIDTDRLHLHGMKLKFANLMHQGVPFLDRWIPRLLKPLRNGTLSVNELFTSTCPLDDAQAAMEMLADDDSHVKLAIVPE